MKRIGTLIKRGHDLIILIKEIRCLIDARDGLRFDNT